MRKPFRIRFSLASLFVIVAIPALWLGWHASWIHSRHKALESLRAQGVAFDEGGHAPLRLRMLGETGVAVLVVDSSSEQPSERTLELIGLFPEAYLLRDLRGELMPYYQRNLK